MLAAILSGSVLCRKPPQLTQVNGDSWRIQEMKWCQILWELRSFRNRSEVLYSLVAKLLLYLNFHFFGPAVSIPGHSLHFCM